MIGAERVTTMHSGWKLWRLFADLCGWRVPDSKSPLPSQLSVALGAEFDLRAFPSRPIIVRLTDQRIETIIDTLSIVLDKGSLGSGLAGQLWGKLQHACSMLWGRFGVCKLRPFSRRQHEQRTALNPQLRSSILWWLKALRANAFPREVPLSLTDMKTVVSYSDGEGGDAGVGVAIWADDLEHPLAAYTRIPREVRLYWSAGQRGAVRNDIFEIEAIGPLLILATWPRIMQNRLWVHYIDNAAAQAAFVKGSSSVMSGDVLVGHAWELIARRRLLPWIDRVDSESNPVDGLSRGRMEGPWQQVEEAQLPGQLRRELRQAHFG